jgi:hypothetical protein
MYDENQDMLDIEILKCCHQKKEEDEGALKGEN